MTASLLSKALVPPKFKFNHHPGHWEKMNKTDVYSSGVIANLNTSKLNTIFAEMEATPALRGVTLVQHWGWIEDTAGGNPATWNWEAIDNIVQRLYTLRQAGIYKYFCISIDMEVDGIALGDLQDLLPPDLVVTGGYTPVQPGYTAYTYAWPWTKSDVAEGYYVKLWEPVIQTRFAAFVQAIADHVVPLADGTTLNAGDYLYIIRTLESATSDPYDTFQGGSLQEYQKGLVDIVLSMKESFTTTIVQFGSNYPRSFMAQIMPNLAEYGLGTFTPNMNHSAGLINSSVYTPGILLYFEDPEYYDNMPITVGIQGDDVKATTGIDARSNKTTLYDFPPLADLYARCVNELHVQHIEWLRVNTFWEGGTYSETFVGSPTHPEPYTWPNSDPVESILAFLQTDPLVNATDFGGLNAVRPAYILTPGTYASAAFYAPLTSTLTLTNGTGSPTFTRATSASIVDSATGLLTTVTSGNPRFDSQYGLLIESEARTNTLLWCRDLTNAVWNKTGITAAKTQTGIDGSANSCSLLTATTTNGTVFQNISASASAGCSSFYVKRSVGTGTISITRNGGTSWTDITNLINSSTFTRVVIENTSVLNPQVGFRISTSADAIIVDYGQNELGTKVSSPILTTSASSTRNAETLTYPKSGNIVNGGGTILADVTRLDWSGADVGIVGSSTIGLFATSTGATAKDGVNSATSTDGTPTGTKRLGMKYLADCIQSMSGESFGLVLDQAMPEQVSGNLSNIGIGVGFSGYIKKVAIWPKIISNYKMKNIS